MGALQTGALIGFLIGLIAGIALFCYARSLKTGTDVFDAVVMLIAGFVALPLLIAGVLLGLLGGFIFHRAGLAGIGVYLGAWLIFALTLTLSKTRPWERLEARRADAACERSRLFLDAARRGDLAQARALLDRSVYVDVYFTHDPEYGKTALMTAVEAGNVALVKMLVMRGADCDLVVEGQTARTLAEQGRRPEILLNLRQPKLTV